MFSGSDLVRPAEVFDGKPRMVTLSNGMVVRQRYLEKADKSNALAKLPKRPFRWREISWGPNRYTRRRMIYGNTRTDNRWKAQPA
jgi:hypothetical protein